MKYLSSRQLICLLAFSLYPLHQVTLPQREPVKLEPRLNELALTLQQITFIQDHTPKLLAWETHWTWDKDDIDEVYLEHIGKRMPVKLISLKAGVLVLIPRLQNIAILYVRMPDGRLDYPTFVDTLWMRGNESLDKPIRSVPGWEHLYSIFGPYDTVESGLTWRQRKDYLKDVKSSEGYWKVESEITLLPLEPFRYEPPGQDKDLLLERVLKAAKYEAEKTYKPGETISITIPNFNVGDSRILFLLESEQEGGIVISYQLNMYPKDGHIFFLNVVDWDTTVDRYGVKEDWAEKIKLRALKVLQYKIESKH